MYRGNIHSTRWMLTNAQIVLALSIATLAPASSFAQSKVVKTFLTPDQDSRLDACTLAKKSAQIWADDEARKPLATAIATGRPWLAKVGEYSQCDCEEKKTNLGVRWACSVDATIVPR
jgi:hypothetical protein